ncbi:MULTISPECIES: DNA recombination protein RmuC [unclassified Bifidobacterium]|uniref:DNA recombination protein RmuC n=1 Tax=Bifidobacterium TaxID=1678 RepID=UPI000C14D95E|nr:MULTISPECIES: DNA recombination protein RmuC [unclassified Bifidobacterium]MDU2100554.1 DNA recombination protein RmuC [Bifidobacterium sp.]MDU8951505.1 DNA recombination protein RmuC [Bifidobacterium sp.]PIB85693.1 DNA recombination protein RmuC [Bifidobacterium sp. N4G05]
MFDNPVFVVILLVVVAALGAAAGFFAGRAKGQEMARDAKTADLNEAKAQIEADRQEISELSTSVTQYRTQAEGLAQQLTYLKSQLAQAQRAEQERVERERERAAAEAERKQAENERKLQEQSKVLSALAPVQKNLDALQQKVSQIEEGRKREMGALGEQLKGLGEQQARLDRETNALSSALRNNKVRGAWGEAQLRNIVESAGLLEHVDFDTQVVVTDADGRAQRPDMIIHMPGGKTIPIDAKAPYADYQKACEIPDTATPEELARKSELLHAHAKAVRDHVKTLGDKAYWNAFDDAPDFVIAFIPNESLLQAALETDPTLMDDAFARKVALTSPITLWAVLKSVAYAWQQQSLTDDAKMLFDLSRELYERFAVLGDRATKLGSAITKTVGAYNAFASSLESRVLVTARKLQRVDQSRIIEPVNMIAPEKADVRELNAPETSAQ